MSQLTGLGGTDSPSDDRQRRLADRVRRLRTSGASGGLDRWLLIIGGALLPIGLLVVALGWLGASRTPLVFEQIPYLISGGALGLALTFAGGFTYFAYWQTVKIRDGRAQHRELIETLQRMEQRFDELETEPANGTVTGARASNGRTPSVGRPIRSSLVATETGSMVHTRECPVVAGRDRLKAVAADGGGLIPCKICDPLGVHA